VEESFWPRIQAIHSVPWNVGKDTAIIRAIDAVSAGLFPVNTGTWSQTPHLRTALITNGHGEKV
jgi:hypothetical protein